MTKLLASAATGVGRAVRALRTLPGLAGAAGISYGAARLGGLAVGLIVGGAFLLLLDREL